MEDGASRTINIAEIKLSGEMAVSILRRALDAFARLDTVAAAQIVRDDKAIDEEFRAFVRKLISYMTEDPRSISVGLDFLFIAKAIERIGDHAKNIAEFIILHRQGYRRAAQVARRARTRSTQLIQHKDRGADAQQHSRH
jgi:Phosphate uptake regulator